LRLCTASLVRLRVSEALNAHDDDDDVRMRLAVTSPPAWTIMLALLSLSNGGYHWSHFSSLHRGRERERERERVLPDNAEVTTAITLMSETTSRSVAAEQSVVDNVFVSAFHYKHRQIQR